MPNMQAFRQSLSANTNSPNQRHSQLAHLTHVKRDQILALASELTWYIWNEEPDPSGAQ